LLFRILTIKIRPPRQYGDVRMKKIKVMVNGLPGKMAWAVAEAIISSSDMELIPYSFTGPEITDQGITVGGMTIILVKRGSSVFSIGGPDVMVDFTQPEAISGNVRWYCENYFPFVMGTTGGDLNAIKKLISKSKINAVVAPNMAKEIVIFQAMMEFAAENFPGALKDFSLKVVESHQKTKPDTSGTAKAVVASFNKLGIPFLVEQIDKKRDEDDYEFLKVPMKFWSGHGWHNYTLKKTDGSVFLQFKHNVNGRQAYIDGTLDAIRFLNKEMILSFDRGAVFSMIDVLKGK